MTPLSLSAFHRSGRPHQSSRFPSPAKTHHRPISLLCPAAKVLEALILPSINEFISSAKDQHGFRPTHWTPSVFLQLTTDIETGFNQRKPPHRTVCVAIDLTAAFDTVSHDTLISKIAGSSMLPAITQWLSSYLRGRQAATRFRGRARESSAPASLKDKSCHLPCSTIT